MKTVKILADISLFISLLLILPGLFLFFYPHGGAGFYSFLPTTIFLLFSFFGYKKIIKKDKNSVSADLMYSVSLVLLIIFGGITLFYFIIQMWGTIIVEKDQRAADRERMEQFLQVEEALIQYKEDNGQYPELITDLSPEYFNYNQGEGVPDYNEKYGGSTMYWIDYAPKSKGRELCVHFETYIYDEYDKCSDKI